MIGEVRCIFDQGTYLSIEAPEEKKNNLILLKIGNSEINNLLFNSIFFYNKIYHYDFAIAFASSGKLYCLDQKHYQSI